jgi:hypothetical protein
LININRKKLKERKPKVRKRDWRRRGEGNKEKKVKENKFLR